MLETLRDLYAHEEWADALHWSAIESFPAALTDADLAARLNHLHAVQRGFLMVFKGEVIDIRAELAKSPVLAELKAVARQYHNDVRSFISGLEAGQLSKPLTIPWFPGGFSLPLRDAALQAAMHSHYHRGQNATRLKQLGAKPPTTDYIVWVYKGRPAAEWP